jgi:uncharacterized phage-associated protein
MKSNELADVIVARQPGLSSMKLQKLLYYIQAWHLAITDQPLFEEDFLGFADGPVVYEVWKARQDYGTRRHATTPAPELSHDASVIIDLVLAEYGGRSGDELSALTHTEAPWLESRQGLREGQQGRRPVTKESMARFFRDHRTLGSRTAADLAAGGLYLHAPEAACDVKELLDTFDMAWPDDDVEEAMVSFWPIDEVDHDGVRSVELA